ncbi:MAG: hypothetical protein Q9222_002493 [Ikaeria aurantiellina]
MAESMGKDHIVTLGVVLSYFPQFQRIISRGSSQGISIYFALSSTVFTTSALANILLLESVNGGYDCCRAGNPHAAMCFTALATTTQAALEWLGATIFFVIFLIFYPRPLTLPSEAPKRHSLSKSSIALSPERRQAEASRPYPRLPKLIASTSLILNLLILIPTLSIVLSPEVASAAPKSLLQDWSFFTSTLSLLAATVQFLPQIHATFQLRHHQSLSIVMLVIQVPVSIILGLSKASTATKVPHNDTGSGSGDRKHWVLRWLQSGEIAWMNYIVAGCVEGLLLALCLYLHFVRPRFKRGDDLEGDEEAAEEEYIVGISMGEETPLLPGRRTNDLQASRMFGREALGGR